MNNLTLKHRRNPGCFKRHIFEPLIETESFLTDGPIRTVVFAQTSLIESEMESFNGSIRS